MPAEGAAAIYSLIGSAKLNGLDPEADPVELADALNGFAGDSAKRGSLTIVGHL